MNEVIGFSSITRKRYQTVPNATYYTVRKWLHCLHIRDTMYPEYRKECRSNDCYGRIPDPRRNCKGPQKVRGHSHAATPTRQITGLQSRRLMDREQERLRQLVSRTEQLRQTQGQIKIATYQWWQTTIENLVAFRSSALLWKVKANDPWNSLPFFMIHSCLTKSKTVLSESWVCSRKEVYS